MTEWQQQSLSADHKLGSKCAGASAAGANNISCNWATTAGAFRYGSLINLFVWVGIGVPATCCLTTRSTLLGAYNHLSAAGHSAR